MHMWQEALKLLRIIVALQLGPLFCHAQGEVRFSQSAEEVEIERVYVFAGNSEPCEGADLSAQSLTDYAEVRLMTVYDILERRHLAEILDEQRLGMSGLVFEDQAIQAGCLQGSQGVVFCEVGCLVGQNMVKLKLVDCEASMQQWSILGISKSPSELLDKLIDEIQESKSSTPAGTLETKDDRNDASSFQCGSTIDHLGHSYHTVEIGDQCWFAENLRSSTYTNGDAITRSLDDREWKSISVGACSVYENDSNALAEYGLLYNWFAIDDERGLCPPSWHVPSIGDWSDLTKSFGDEAIAGKLMRSEELWIYGSSETEQAGAKGFDALPGGSRRENGSYVHEGTGAGWWSSSRYGTDAWYLFMSSNSAHLGRTTGNQHHGFSVRCVQDVD